MNDANCPYCGEPLEINHDDGYGYGEEELYQQECAKCEKTFCYTTRISFNHNTYKADCLNGGEHDYKKTITYPEEASRLRCTMCGDEQPLKSKLLEAKP